MYVAVKGGEQAILASYRLLDDYRRGDTALPALTLSQIREQMPLAVSKVMSEGALYDPHLAALAIKQSAGDLIEAVFLLRAYRTTLPRFGYALPIDTDRMSLSRRISATFKDLPGGQILGPTYDYTQRLLDFALEADEGATPGAYANTGHAGACQSAPLSMPVPMSKSAPMPTSMSITAPQPTSATQPTSAPQPTLAPQPTSAPEYPPTSMPRVTTLLARDDLVEKEAVPEGDPDPADVTRESLGLPAGRSARLQNLARADEGFLLSMGYSTQRGYGNTHPFAAEIRYGDVEVEMFIEELGFPVTIGAIEVTECQMVSQFVGSGEHAPHFTRGYGLSFGYSERKAMSMSLVDRALRAKELGEAGDAPANDEEFVLYHSDNVEASGFVQHLKLPHHVDFQSNMELLRRLRQEYAERLNGASASAQADAASEGASS